VRLYLDPLALFKCVTVGSAEGRAFHVALCGMPLWRFH
jgi:hypothetical protein